MSTGPQLRDATAPLRHPVRISAPPGRFSVCRPLGLLQGFLRERSQAFHSAVANFQNGAHYGGTDTCCERRTIASGRSQATVGKRQRKRQKSRQVTDLPCNRQVAAAAVFPAVSLFAGQHVSGPPFNRRCSPKVLSRHDVSASPSMRPRINARPQSWLFHPAPCAIVSVWIGARSSGFSTRFVEARASGEPAAIATIVRVRGSAYRREGTHMLIRSDGTLRVRALWRMPGAIGRRRRGARHRNRRRRLSSTTTSLTTRSGDSAWAAAAPSTSASSGSTNWIATT